MKVKSIVSIIERHSLDSSLNERPPNKKGKLFAALFVLETAK
jgi:hypothetical protein